MISIVIPIYNAEKYIQKCLDRILSQETREIEVVLVNDGSIDDSLNICKAYSKEDKRIIVIDQENRGPAEARKAGVFQASGEYVLFLDSDDYIADDTIQTLYGYLDQFPEVDIIHFNYHIMDTNEKLINTMISPFSPRMYDKEKLNKIIYPSMMYFDSFYRFGVQPPLWNKLIKRTIILEFISSIPSDVFFGEDGLLTYQCFFYAKSVLFIEDVLYYYRETEGSITRTINKNKNLLEQNNRLIKEYEKVNDLNKKLNKSELANYVIYLTWMGIHGEYIKCMENNEGYEVFCIARDKIKIDLTKYYRNHKWKNVSIKTRVRMYLVAHLDLKLLYMYFRHRYK